MDVEEKEDPFLKDFSINLISKEYLYDLSNCILGWDEKLPTVLLARRAKAKAVLQDFNTCRAKKLEIEKSELDYEEILKRVSNYCEKYKEKVDDELIKETKFTLQRIEKQLLGIKASLVEEIKNGPSLHANPFVGKLLKIHGKDDLERFLTYERCLDESGSSLKTYLMESFEKLDVTPRVPS
jgi:hypothetical protein